MYSNWHIFLGFRADFVFFKISLFCSLYHILLTGLSCAALKHSFAWIITYLACKLSIDMKTCICILHPQFTFNSLLRITGGLHLTKCQFQDTEMCGCSCATTQTTAHTRAHTHVKLWVGKEIPSAYLLASAMSMCLTLKPSVQQRLVQARDFPFCSLTLLDFIIY